MALTLIRMSVGTWKQRWWVFWSNVVSHLTRRGTLARTDAIGRKTRQLVDVRRTKRIASGLCGVGVATLVYIIPNMSQLHEAGLWSGGADTHALRSFLFNGLHLDLLCLNVGSVVILWVHPSQRGWCVDVLHAIFMSFVVMHTWLYTDVVMFILRSGQEAVLRIAGGVLFGNARYVCLLNVLCSVVTGARIMTSSVLSADAFLLISAEILISVTVTLVATVHESTWHNETLSIVEAASSSRSERKGQELLTLLCDVVLSLDGKLRVQKPSPALATLLLAHCAEDLCDTDFVNLMCTCDRERFLDFIHTCCGHAQCIHVHLLDICGNRVAVQILHTPSENALGEKCHLIVIREELNTKHNASITGSSDFLSSSTDSYESNAERGERGGSATGSDELLPLSSVSTMSQACFACFDALSDNYELIECSPSFTAIGGPMRTDDGLLDWIHGGRGQTAFSAWVQEATNFLKVGETSTASHRFEFAPPHLQPSISVSADCELRLMDVAEDEDDREDVLYVQITMSNLTRLSRRPRRASHKPRVMGAMKMPPLTTDRSVQASHFLL
eukprot:CAMPEP_0194525304 /NCGR_PEP_ID=MMETSP0253-20130528/60732_1 /TAXON_ID=2966 /ORGANISM="Noctiluca scintillans" /LENGTH=558 /DNA_ID=CAMNT_0039370019 /DNA_START=119 /DNA_END=1795 /DNA_ORIENTATION=+